MDCVWAFGSEVKYFFSISVYIEYNGARSNPKNATFIAHEKKPWPQAEENSQFSLAMRPWGLSLGSKPQKISKLARRCAKSKSMYS